MLLNPNQKVYYMVRRKGSKKSPVEPSKQIEKTPAKKLHSSADDKAEALKTVTALLKGKKKGDRGYDRLKAKKKSLEADCA